ncbi:MAG TPA: DNA gyrase inhibitor YacG [Pyrinomonadaceae bacterium]|nr:DNA gyrase inhibitor YacG [Pyrinomonadaceae bacterium]
MKCPSCDKPVQWQDNPFRPFCSERCKLVDLGRWVNEEYRVPGQRVPSPGVDEKEQRSNSED